MPSPQPLGAPRRMLYVFLGGAMGVTARSLLLLVPVPATDTVKLVVINLIGSCLLGLLLGAVTRPAADGARALLGTGLMGGFTSYSALVGAMMPGADGWFGVALAVTSVLGGTALALACLRIGSAWAAVRPAEAEAA